MLFALETIGVSEIIILWLIFEKKPFQFWRGNLNLGLSYLITTVLFENFQAKAPRNNDKENKIVLHLSVHFKVHKKTQKKT